MTRPEVIAALTRATTAEAALAVQLRNIVNTFSWSGLPASKRRSIAESLEAMSAPAGRRARRIKALLERLEGGSTMFSKSTFQRYLFDISSTQQEMTGLYQSLLDNLADSALRKELAEFLGQVKSETETINRIRQTLQQET